MKVDFRHLAFLVFAFLVSVWVLVFMYGCSAKYHLNKYQNKGGTCGKIDTIRTVRYDTLTNTFYKFDSLVIVNDRIVPQTRLETRISYMIHKDTVRYNTKVIKYMYKEKKQEVKKATKNSRTFNIIVICSCILIVFLIINRIFKL